MDRKNDVYYFEEPAESPLEQMEDQYENGDMLQNLLFGAVFGVVFLFLLSLCWNRCAGDDACTETKPETQNMVIAQEIKPGIIVIQGGSQEETMRIIQEYEAIRMQGHVLQQPPPPNYGSAGVGAMGGAHHQMPLGSPDPFQLIDLDGSAPRPPPYAPHHK